MKQIHTQTPVTMQTKLSTLRADSSIPSGRNAPPRRVLLALDYPVLGNNILAIPALRAVRQYWPQAEISVLTGPVVGTLLQGCPYVDDFILFEPRWHKWEPWTNLSLIRTLRRRAFDKAIMFTRLIHPAVMATTARIPERIGYATDLWNPFLTQRVPYLGGREVYEIDRSLNLLTGAGLDAEVTAPQLWVTPRESAAALQCLADHGVRGDKVLVGMQPGSNFPKVREWGAERFALVADRLTQELDAQVVLLGSACQGPVSQRTAAAMRTRPVVLTGTTNLRQAMAIIAQCDLWVGNDGGLLHAAFALGPATVGIFGPTKSMQWGHQGPRHRTLVVDPTAQRRSDQTIRSCLDAISTSAVFDAAVEALRESETAGRQNQSVPSSSVRREK